MSPDARPGLTEAPSGMTSSIQRSVGGRILDGGEVHRGAHCTSKLIAEEPWTWRLHFSGRQRHYPGEPNFPAGTEDPCRPPCAPPEPSVTNSFRPDIGLSRDRHLGDFTEGRPMVPVASRDPCRQAR